MGIIGRILRRIFWGSEEAIALAQGEAPSAGGGSGGAGDGAAFSGGQAAVVTRTSDDSNAPLLTRGLFDLPLTATGQGAIDFIRSSVGAAAAERGMRVFEYSLAAGHAHNLRPDRELVLIGSLFSVLGDKGAASAQAFSLERGIWPALAEKVSGAVEAALQGSKADDPETQALSLGLAAEGKGGDVDYVHSMTAHDIESRHGR